MAGTPRGGGRLAPEAKTRNMTEEPALTLTCPKCGAPLIAAADLQTTDKLQCPEHGDTGTLGELLDQTLQRQMGNALTEALKKDDHDVS